MYGTTFFVEDAKICERAADIDSDSIAHANDCLPVTELVKGIADQY